MDLRTENAGVQFISSKCISRVPLSTAGLASTSRSISTDGSVKRRAINIAETIFGPTRDLESAHDTVHLLYYLRAGNSEKTRVLRRKKSVEIDRPLFQDATLRFFPLFLSFCREDPFGPESPEEKKKKVSVAPDGR